MCITSLNTEPRFGRIHNFIHLITTEFLYAHNFGNACRVTQFTENQKVQSVCLGYVEFVL